MPLLNESINLFKKGICLGDYLFDKQWQIFYFIIIC